MNYFQKSESTIIVFSVEEKGNELKKLSYILLLLISVLCIGCGQTKTDENVKSNENIKDDKEEFTLEELCKSYAANYEIEESSSESMYQVKIKAPNFEKIAEIIINNENYEKLDQNLFLNAIYENPELEKQYIINVNSENEIEDAFLDQIVYELITAAIKDVEITEEEEVTE